MKKRLAIIMIFALVLPSMACRLLTGNPKPNPTPIPPAIGTPTQELQPPTEPATPTEALPPTPGKVTQAAATPVATFTQLPATQEATFLPLVPTATTGESAASRVIDSVTLARDTQGEDKHPVNPTTIFATDAMIHAVVHLKNAPANTKITATWYVVDAGSAVTPNSEIDTTAITTDGTRYIDFTLSPKDQWPVGTYKVTISLNGQVVETKNFSVQ